MLKDLTMINALAFLRNGVYFHSTKINTTDPSVFLKKQYGSKLECLSLVVTADQV
jgi:hypothetical protein